MGKLCPHNFEIQEHIFRAGLDRSIRSARADLDVTDFHGGVLNLSGVVFQTVRSAERDFQRLGHRGRSLVELEILDAGGPVGDKGLPVKLRLHLSVRDEGQVGRGIQESGSHRVHVFCGNLRINRTVSCVVAIDRTEITDDAGAAAARQIRFQLERDARSS